MVNPIPNTLKRLWDKWDVRCVILSSLSLQIILILFSPMRKRTNRSFAILLIWSAYLLADYAAILCVGLISNRNGSSSTITKNDDILAFWAPFLLLHLGGPDTITAFALEDNELWLRHLLGVIVQVSSTFYIFLLTVPGNTLWIPTVLVFIAGIIKFTERTRSLYLASMGTFRQSMVQDSDPGPNYAKLMDEYSSKKKAGLPASIVVVGEPKRLRDSHRSRKDGEGKNNTLDDDIQFVLDGYYFFNKFKGLIVEMIYSVGDRNESSQYFLNEEKKPEDFLQVIEVELDFMYEFFYTKASVLHNKTGYLFRFVALSSMVAAFVLFSLHPMGDFDNFEFDVRVTYTLLCGAVALDTLALLMHFFSDRAVVSLHQSHRSSHKVTDMIINFFKSNICKHFLCLNKYFLGLRKPKWSPSKTKLYSKYDALSTAFVFRRWSGTVSGLNLITYCLHKCPRKTSQKDSHGFRHPEAIHPRVMWFKAMQLLKDALDRVIKYFGVRDMLDKWLYKEKNPFLKKLWYLIFKQLKEKAKEVEQTGTTLETTRKICAARGEWALNKSDLEDKDKKKLIHYVKEVAFDESLILWHIATHLFYNDGDGAHDKRFSLLLSDYMLYLLVMEPRVMSGVAGIGLKRFKDTCDEAIRFFSKRELDTEAKDNNSTSKEEEKENRNTSEEEKKACATLLHVCTEIEPIAVKGDRSKSVLFDACRLAKVLKDLNSQDKWKIIEQIWVELLLFAASNCRPTTLVNQLSKGGELISFVWLLMVQMGLGNQFQIQEGHARAKLIVSRSRQLLNPT